MPSPGAGSTVATPGAIIGSYYHTVSFAAALTTLVTGAKNITSFYIDNRRNTVDVELHLWDALIGSVTFGTTEPDAIITCRAGKELKWALEYLMAFGTGVTGALTTAGGKSITSGPANVVPVTVGLS